MWDVQTAEQDPNKNGGKFTCFEPNLAAKAQSMAGTGRTVTVRVEQKGQYWNFIDAFDNGAAAPIVNGTVPQAQQSYGPPPPVAPSSGGGDYSPERSAKIARQNANTAAATLIGGIYAGAGPESLPEAIKAFQRLAREMVGFGLNGVFADPGQQAEVKPQTPAEVAAVVNAEVPEAVAVGAPAAEQAAQASDVEWN